jgi:hypothetical protein
MLSAAASEQYGTLEEYSGKSGEAISSGSGEISSIQASYGSRFSTDGLADRLN